MPEERKYSQHDIEKMVKEAEDTTAFRVGLKKDVNRLSSTIEDLSAIIVNMQTVCGSREDECFKKAKEYVNERVAWALGIPAVIWVGMLIHDKITGG